MEHQKTCNKIIQRQLQMIKERYISIEKRQIVLIIWDELK